jgi:hypothetical protein
MIRVEERFRKEKSHDDMVKFATSMKEQVTSKLTDTSNQPAIFPLLCKLYLPDDTPKATTFNDMLKCTENSICFDRSLNSPTFNVLICMHYYNLCKLPKL